MINYKLKYLELRNLIEVLKWILRKLWKKYCRKGKIRKYAMSIFVDSSRSAFKSLRRQRKWSRKSQNNRNCINVITLYSLLSTFLNRINSLFIQNISLIKSKPSILIIHNFDKLIKQHLVRYLIKPSHLMYLLFGKLNSSHLGNSPQVILIYVAFTILIIHFKQRLIR